MTTVQCGFCNINKSNTCENTITKDESEKWVCAIVQPDRYVKRHGITWTQAVMKSCTINSQYKQRVLVDNPIKELKRNHKQYLINLKESIK
jgi:hypothetical protein